MSTLVVVEEILRETSVPMSVREIVERAGARLPSKSKTPDTVVARDLSMDIKKKGEGSLFTRTSPGRYTLRSLAANAPTAHVQGAQAAQGNELAAIASSGTVARPTGTVISAAGNAAMGTRKPAAPATTSTSVAVAARSRDADGGGYAG
jgi:hypothetical protein